MFFPITSKPTSPSIELLNYLLSSQSILGSALVTPIKLLITKRCDFYSFIVTLVQNTLTLFQYCLLI